MALWTDIIEPAELTGYARKSLEEREKKNGSLATFLPYREVFDIAVRFRPGESGLVDEANFRAYDAEPEIAHIPGGKRVTIDLPSISQRIPITEEYQLRLRGAGDEAWRKYILEATDHAVNAIADQLERMRGIVLATGKATIDQKNFQLDESFGRSSDMTVTAATKWNESGSTPIDDLIAWVDKYSEVNGEKPQWFLIGSKALRALLKSEQMRTVLPGGATRQATLGDLTSILDANDLPMIYRYDRRTKSGRVIPDDKIIFLPEGDQLGATFVGQTLASTNPKFSLADSDQPGIVAGVWQHEDIPMQTAVVADAIALPVLANANLSMAATVI